MTKANETKTAKTAKTVETVIIPAMVEYNVTDTEQAAMLAFLKGQTKTGLNACKNWFNIGTVLSRIADNTNRSTRNGVIAEIFNGHKWGKDEINYAIKMSKIDGLVKWYADNGCTRHNPRTIYTAYVEGNKSEEDKKADKAEKEAKAEEKDLETEKKYLDVAKSLTQTMKYWDNATENGNLTANEMSIILNQLKEFTIVVETAHKLEAKAEAVAGHKAEKKEKKVA